MVAMVLGASFTGREENGVGEIARMWRDAIRRGGEGGGRGCSMAFGG